MNALDLELELDRREGELAPRLAAHGAAVVEACRGGTWRPPWPDELLDERWARLLRAASTVGDPILIARSGTLARWSLAAQVAADRDVRAAALAPRTLDGLAVRHAALWFAGERRRLTVPALVERLYGAAPALVDVPAAALPAAAAPPPTLATVQAALGAHAGVRARELEVITPSRTSATVLVGRRVICLIAQPPDPHQATALAAHELGHGVYALAHAGLPLGLAAAPSRVFDEAIAAWAVRRIAPIEAARAARLHAALARFEARAFAREPIAAAWEAELGARDPATVPSLFDEPGVAIAYARADALRLDPAPRQLAAWGAQGAALDPVA